MHEVDYDSHDGMDAGSRAVEELSHLRERLTEIGANAAYLLERASLLDRQAAADHGNSTHDALQQATHDENMLHLNLHRADP